MKSKSSAHKQSFLTFLNCRAMQGLSYLTFHLILASLMRENWNLNFERKPSNHKPGNQVCEQAKEWTWCDIYSDIQAASLCAYYYYIEGIIKWRRKFCLFFLLFCEGKRLSLKHLLQRNISRYVVIFLIFSIHFKIRGEKPTDLLRLANFAFVFYCLYKCFPYR